MCWFEVGLFVFSFCCCYSSVYYFWIPDIFWLSVPYQIYSLQIFSPVLQMLSIHCEKIVSDGIYLFNGQTITQGFQSVSFKIKNLSISLCIQI